MEWPGWGNVLPMATILLTLLGLLLAARRLFKPFVRLTATEVADELHVKIQRNDFKHVHERLDRMEERLRAEQQKLREDQQGMEERLRAEQQKLREDQQAMEKRLRADQQGMEERLGGAIGELKELIKEQRAA